VEVRDMSDLILLVFIIVLAIYVGKQIVKESE